MTTDAQKSTTDLDAFSIHAESFLLVTKEFLDVLSLVALELDHLTHLRVVDDRAIAGEFLFDDLQDFLLVELFRQSLNCGQGFTAIAFLSRTRVSRLLRKHKPR